MELHPSEFCRDYTVSNPSFPRCPTSCSVRGKEPKRLVLVKDIVYLPPSYSYHREPCHKPAEECLDALIVADNKSQTLSPIYVCNGNFSQCFPIQEFRLLSTVAPPYILAIRPGSYKAVALVSPLRRIPSPRHRRRADFIAPSHVNIGNNPSVTCPQHMFVSALVRTYSHSPASHRVWPPPS